eukprot:TRINITY_DN20102_c0_g1_i1.p1 TRINITY_DN20102_c0_g1~~TRINITY_DN20102_c0_g1_i1.p1  ORF type:complete len:765 (+),score=114.72 TRINITY_DN20102_c0_g1_i1:232-2295(+)
MTATVSVCSSCHGSRALLADLEDLSAHIQDRVRVCLVNCLGACGRGPNCLVDTPPQAPQEELASPVSLGRDATRGSMLRRACGASKDVIGVLRGSASSKSSSSRVPTQTQRESRRRQSAACSTGRGVGRSTRLMSHNLCFENSLTVLREALGGVEPQVPHGAIRRARLRSDAMRLLETGKIDDVANAEALLSEAIDLEMKAAAAFPAHAGDGTTRLRELRLLRAQALSASAPPRLDEALQDLDIVLASEQRDARALTERVRILRRARRIVEALECSREVLKLPLICGKAVALPQDFRLSSQQRRWTEKVCKQLEDQVLEQSIINRGDLAIADAGDEISMDSGCGGGRWKVVQIIGLTWDTCVYRIVNHPPAVPHPYPHDAWHVSVHFGADSRQYTPISTAAEWEEGRLDLLVKTYVDGNVSRRFALLHHASVHRPLEEQSCWVTVSAPVLTLSLPDLRHPCEDASGCSDGVLSHLGLVVGGTGVAPALQLLREAASLNGAFGANCKATLLYSSRTPMDVLLLDAMRGLEAASPWQIQILHTLTDWDVEGAGDPAPFSAQTGQHTQNKRLPHMMDQHYNFRSWRHPLEPVGGPLRTGAGEEARFRGRVDAGMLAEALPQPAADVKVVVSGPSGMWEDVQAALVSLGHDPKALVELEALSPAQKAELRERSERALVSSEVATSATRKES